MEEWQRYTLIKDATKLFGLPPGKRDKHFLTCLASNSQLKSFLRPLFLLAGNVFAGQTQTGLPFRNDFA